MVHSKLSIFCCVFHYFFAHLVLYNGDFGKSVCLKLINARKLLTANFCCRS